MKLNIFTAVMANIAKQARKIKNWIAVTVKQSRETKFIIYSFMMPLFLTACATDINPPPAPNSTGTIAVIGAVAGGLVAGPAGLATANVGALFGGAVGSVIGSRLDKQKTLVSELQGYDIRFFEVGNQITVVLPADRFFKKNSSAVNTYAYAQLRKVIKLLNQYQKVGVKVSGYTDNQGPIERNKALSTQRAQTVAHYLWSQGIDARLLYAVGYGASHFVASNSTSVGRAANRRIEITLEQVSE
ncbi:MAG: OmpA family protein [Gammaproteobacteria bacterium]